MPTLLVLRQLEWCTHRPALIVQFKACRLSHQYRIVGTRQCPVLSASAIIDIITYNIGDTLFIKTTELAFILF
jgi:hypothetical protein